MKSFLSIWNFREEMMTPALIAHQTKNPFTRLSFIWVIKKPPKSHLSVIGVNERRAVAPAFHQKAICW
ncbi:hypothetical protein B9J85_05275 [Vibrio sp. V11_P1A41T118]|nr:hypothetical protein B9J85_05275 [Vibrio sp. V11_P1A41T118]